MRKITLIATTIILAASSIGCTKKLRLIEYLSPETHALENAQSAFVPVAPERWKLANGMQVLFVKDTEVPLVQVQLLVPGGALWEPDSRAGLVSAMGELLRKAGAGDLSAEQLDRTLSEKAAAITTQFGAEFGLFKMSCLNQDLDSVFKLFSDVVLRPKFEKSRIALWKGQALEAIKRRVEEPSTVAALALQQALYSGSAFGRIMLPSYVERVSKPLLQEVHSRWVRPNRAVMVISGDVSRQTAEQLISDAFSDWQPSGEVNLTPPVIPAEPEPGVLFVNLPFPQSTILIGQLGVERQSPDMIAIDAFNEVFGASGFGSRLMKRIRTELGLAYSIGGAIQPGLVKGINSISLGTKSESAGQAMSEAVQVVKQMQQELVSVAELDEKRRSVSNAFIFNFENPESVAGRIAKLELLGYPVDYDATYLSKLAAVTPEDLKTVAIKRWNPERFVVVVVGDEAAYTAVEQALAKEPVISGMKLKRLSLELAAGTKG